MLELPDEQKYELAGSIDVLIGCETSGRVRNAMLKRGFNAFSCDILPSEDGSNRHWVCDVRDAIQEQSWDFLSVMHPPCTRLCNSGSRWLKVPPEGFTLEEMFAELEAGCQLFSECLNADIPHVCVENPVMHYHAKQRIENYIKPHYVQPWWFGDKAFKRTGLFMHNLPKLVKTSDLVPPKPKTAEHKAWSHIHHCPPGPERERIRSRTFQGLADAIATQWGDFLLEKYLCRAA